MLEIFEGKLLEVGKVEIAELVTAWELFVKKRAYKEWLMIFELVFLVKSTRRTVRSIVLDFFFPFSPFSPFSPFCPSISCNNKSECTLCGREGGWGVGNAKPLANPPHSAHPFWTCPLFGTQVQNRAHCTAG